MRIPRKSNWFATEEGTPQGGIISPALANWTLDGLESLLKRTFPSRKEKGRRIHSKVHLVRYADDFIITGRSQAQLVNEVHHWWNSSCASGDWNSQRKRLT